MDKPLSKNIIIDNTGTQESPSTLQPAKGGAISAPETADKKADLGQGVGAYSAQSTHAADLSTKTKIISDAWKKAGDEQQGNAWNADPARRLAIRAFSRGVLGAVFFTAGGYLASRSMKTYDISTKFSQTKDPLQFLAKTIDTFVGKPIELTVNALGGHGKDAVRFRQTNWSRRDAWGRSLGDEVVKVTFDFFCASVGDALGRDLIAMVDPNVKKDWLDDKGHFKPTQALKNMLSSAWRYVSYNGGEDWAVAIPYVYFMKAQRGMINHFSPGFRNDFDRAGNGAAFKMANKIQPDGSHKYEAVGNYNKEGAFDLQSRFTVYNVFTLMYREAYNFIAHKMQGQPDNLYGAPDAPEERRGVLGQAGHLAKWFARSVVKGLITMTPSVPFFWITRVPQSRYKATFIEPELGHLSRMDHNAGRRKAVHAHHIYDPVGVSEVVSPDDKSLAFSRYIADRHTGSGAPFERTFVNGHLIDPVMQGKHFDPYRKTFGAVDSVFNAAGKLNDKAARSLDGVAEYADKNWGNFGRTVKKGLEIGSFRKFTRDYVNAAASYTPYMYAKAEAGHLWDNGKTDLAAERMIDGAIKLNWSEFKAGISEIKDAILHEPFSDPAREAEAHRRISIDTTAAETFDSEQATIETRKDTERDQIRNKKKDNWQERVISAKPEDKKAVKKEKKEKREYEKSTSHADQEAMRKLLDELHPPTNSIH